jgi:hypothetical protein
MARYFPVTLMGGRLYPRGISEWAQWDPAELRYISEELLNLGPLDIRIDDPSLILKAIDESVAQPMPSRTLWIREGLEDEVKRIWERGRAQP